MKKSEMREIANNRQNLIGFLHASEITAINANLVDTNVDKKSFEQICSIVLEQYENKLIKNKQATAIFEILASANTQFKIEKFRTDGAGSIYQYSSSHNEYLFYCKGGESKLSKLQKEFGRFA